MSQFGYGPSRIVRPLRSDERVPANPSLYDLLVPPPPVLSKSAEYGAIGGRKTADIRKRKAREAMAPALPTIMAMLAEGKTGAAIAEKIGRHRSSVCKYIAAHGLREKAKGTRS